MLKGKRPLGDKNNDVLYHIPCKFIMYTYNRETHRKWCSRCKEQEDKVRLTKQDLKEGKVESSEARMNINNNGLARHAATCTDEIDWKNARIIGREKSLNQTKYPEGTMAICSVFV